VNDYERIARVIRYLDEHGQEQPSLAVLARFAELSEGHFHRLFHRWAGVTPKDFLQCLTAEFAREQLRASRSVLDASLNLGLSGPSRLHDLMVSLEAATPGEVKSGGADLTLEYGRAQTLFGDCCLAWTARGVA
jgi:AraC family transcriptional regulator, regulatory protein of adaptative response / methylated-DNA-[protein]-cysteine methyltransferase